MNHPSRAVSARSFRGDTARLGKNSLSGWNESAMREGTRKHNGRRLGGALGLLLLVGSSAAAQDWAREMFDHRSHNFGVVARGAKAEHVFTMENIYVEDVRIAAIRTTCGCLEPKVDKRLLKTWEKARITVAMDTRGFRGRKDSTVTVVLDRPFPAEVQLNLYCFIRGDVVVQPGAVQFGTVAQGEPARQKVTISYAGRSDWRIERVESNHPHLVAEVVESPQSVRQLGQVTYDMTVELKEDAPPGYIREQLVLVTNDYQAQAARVPVAVEGVVVSSLSVRPSPLLLPVLEVGGEATRQLVIQGRSPFRVTAVRCDDPRFQFKLPETAQNLHLIPVTFTAEGEPGKVARTIHIETDLAGGSSLDVPVHVQVVEPQASP
jgi:hypothetical protein